MRFPFVHRVARNDGENKEINGNSSLFVTSGLHSKMLTKLYDTNEPIYETKTDLQRQKSSLMVAKGTGRWSRQLGLADVSFYI